MFVLFSPTVPGEIVAPAGDNASFRPRYCQICAAIRNESVRPPLAFLKKFVAPSSHQSNALVFYMTCRVDHEDNGDIFIVSA